MIHCGIRRCVRRPQVRRPFDAIRFVENGVTVPKDGTDSPAILGNVRSFGMEFRSGRLSARAEHREACFSKAGRTAGDLIKLRKAVPGRYASADHLSGGQYWPTCALALIVFDARIR
jgi:hypothetical protein